MPGKSHPPTRLASTMIFSQLGASARSYRYVRRRFPLTLLFGGVGLLLIAIAGVLVFVIFERIAQSGFVETVEQENARDVAHLVGMAADDAGIGPLYVGQRRIGAGDVEAPTLENFLEGDALAGTVLSARDTMDIVGASLYEASGEPVWSFEATHIHRGGTSEGLGEVLGGEISSELELDEEMISADGRRERLDVVETYIPLRTEPDGPLLGAFEVYRDVSESYASLVSDVRGQVLWTTGAVMGGLYVTLVGAIALADRAVSRSRRRAEAEEARRRRHVESLAEIARTVNSDLDLDTVYSHTASSLEGVVPHERMSITLLEERGNRVVFERGAPVQGHRVDAVLPHLPVDRATAAVPVREEHRDAGLHVWIRSPLGRGGEVIGHLNLLRREVAGFTEDEVMLVEEVAQQVSAAIKNARLFDLTRRHVEDLESLAEIGRLASSAPDIAHLYHGLAGRVQELVGCDSLALFLLDPDDSSRAQIYLPRGVAPEITPGASFPRSLFPLDEMLDLEGPRVYGQSEREAFVERYAGIGIAPEHATEAAIAAPLRSPDGGFGVMVFGFAGDEGIREEHVVLAEQVCGQVVGAVANLRALSQLRLRNAALDSAGDAVIIVDGEGRIEYVNDACERLSGHAKSEILGLRLGAARSGESGGFEAPQGMLAAIRDGRSWSGRVTARRKDAGTYPEEVTVSPVAPPVQGPPRFIVVRRDITERVRAEEARRANAGLDSANRQLQREIEARVQLISTVAHELKNPLASVQGFVQLLVMNRDQNLTEKQIERLRVVEHGTERLNHLIDDLLDVSRAEGGRMRLEPSEFDAVEVTREVVASLSPLTASKGQAVDVRAEIDPLSVEIDRSRYGQVLSNLLSNASKYSPEGSEIEILLRGDEGEFRLSVRDHGIGISQEDQEKLFTPFFRAEDPDTQAQSGTGLGLVIVKSIVDLHGGRVQLESAPGEGTEVTAVFPRHVRDQSGNG